VLAGRKIPKLVPLIARARVLAGHEVQAIAADGQKSPGLKSRPYAATQKNEPNARPKNKVMILRGCVWVRAAGM
jgi:hypothetical protein